MARGSILKRRNKNGTTTFSIKYRAADGTQIKKAVGPSRREAERALTDALTKVDRGQVRGTSRETFAEAAPRWLDRKRPLLEESTYRDYEAHLRLRLLPAFGPMPLRRITRRHVEEYVTRLDRADKLSRKTINDSLIPLRQVLARAVAEGVVATNPAVSVDRDAPLELPYERPVMSHLTREQARRYLDSASSWYLPLAEVLLGAGLRIGEAAALEWTDIDWDAGALNITKTVKLGGTGTPKGDRGRSVVVADYLLETLERHRAASRTSSLVFTHPDDGRQLDRHAARRRGHLPTLIDAALPAGVRLHDLRHTAATLWLAAGESIYFVQQQLGHQDIQTTIDLYGHPDKVAHRQAAQRAAAWWRDEPSNGVLEGASVLPLVPRRSARDRTTSSEPVATGSETR